MDPFVESQVWEDFHHAFCEVVREWLMIRVRPRYVIRVEKRVYVERASDDRVDVIRPDVTVLETPDAPPGSSDTTAAVSNAPVTLTIPMPDRKRETFLTIRERETLEVITVLEILSPSNKRPGSQGQREYLTKRAEVLQSSAHLVEMDLLRAGERLPTIEPLPPADYFVFVCREDRRPKVDVYAWSLRQNMPSVPVPLAADDADVSLDLQAVFNTVYDRAGYDYSVNYRLPIDPPLRDADAAWANELVG